ncbi:hypothetical protein AAFC00_002214 [Neodothiora populina]|uniref:Mediator of RNA polymerase II transcription subunit 21 n=1 Tax=Neodothiora populina TaxID=2781224 RepID=A0ABR3PGN6_9PEZI
MADRLTQLQDCYDDLQTQMFACIDYIRTRHQYEAIEGQPDMNPHSSTSANPSALTNGGTANGGDAHQQNQNGQQPQNDSADGLTPDPPEVFKSALTELARDLVIKEQQIEYIISVLPGIGNSEADQDARIRALQTELREADALRTLAMQEREQMLGLIGDLAATCKRVY